MNSIVNYLLVGKFFNVKLAAIQGMPIVFFVCFLSLRERIEVRVFPLPSVLLRTIGVTVEFFFQNLIALL